jgi:autotransporter-associated beta strand protein
LSVGICLSAAFVWAADYSWTNTAAGATFNWNNAGGQNNWVSGFPNAVGDGAYLTNNIVGAQTIGLNQTITVGTLKVGDFNGDRAFTVVPNGGALVLDNGASSAVIAGSGTGAAVDLLSPNILLNSPLELSGSAAATHLLTLGGVITAKDSGQAITVSGGSVTVTNQSMTYSNGWTVRSNATLNASGRSYSSTAPNNIANFALGTTVVANAVSVQNGGTLASSGANPILHLSGPILLNHGATLRQTSSGGGRVGTFADVTVPDAATAAFSYYGNIQENKLRFGTLTLMGNATLDIATISGVAGGGNVGVDPVSIEALTVQPSGTVGTTFPDYTTAEGLKLGAGKTLTKTGNGAFLLNSTNGQFAGSLDIRAGVLSLGHANALNATAGNFVRSNAVVSLRTSGFGVTAHRLNGAVVTQEVGSVERWYHGAARFVAGASDSYTPPPGVALQVGLFATPATHDWSDAGSGASHVLRLTGSSLGVWAEQNNNGPQCSTRAGFIGFSWANTINNTIPVSSNKYSIVLDADSYLGSPDATSYLPEYRQLYINVAIKDGTAGTSITKIGPEAVILSGSNTYSGATVVDSGVLAIGRADSLPVTTALAVNPAGIFDLFNGGDNTNRNANHASATLSGGPGSGNGLQGASYGQTVAGLTGSGIVANGWTNTAILTVNNGMSNTFGGSLTGPLTLAKTGVGTLILSGTNYHTGGTSVSAGTLVANGAAYLAAGTVTGNFGNSSRRTVVVTNASDLGKLAAGQPVSAAILPPGTYITGVTGTTNFLSRYSTNVSSNQLAIAVAYGAGAALGVGPVTVSGTGTLTLNGVLANASVTVSGGKLNGSGTVRLTVDGAACESMTVSGGELDLSGLTLALQTGSGGITEEHYVLIDYSAGGTLTRAPGGVFAAVTGVPAGYAVYDKPSAKRVVLAPPVRGTLITVQ